jgi:hypothetical protein
MGSAPPLVYLVCLVHLVCFVDLVDLVHLVSFVQPKNQTNQIYKTNQRDQMNQTDQTNQITVSLRWQTFSTACPRHPTSLRHDGEPTTRCLADKQPERMQVLGRAHPEQSNRLTAAAGGAAAS